MLDDVVQRLSVVQQGSRREVKAEKERQLKMKREKEREGGVEGTESEADPACNVGRHCRQRHIDGQKLKFADSVWHWLWSLAPSPPPPSVPSFPCQVLMRKNVCSNWQFLDFNLCTGSAGRRGGPKVERLREFDSLMHFQRFERPCVLQLELQLQLRLQFQFQWQLMATNNDRRVRVWVWVWVSVHSYRLVYSFMHRICSLSIKQSAGSLPRTLPYHTASSEMDSSMMRGDGEG